VGRLLDLLPEGQLSEAHPNLDRPWNKTAVQTVNQRWECNHETGTRKESHMTTTTLLVIVLLIVILEAAAGTAVDAGTK
jgi:hypothetical protein